jgi:ligand-binding sensor domain-containing protein/signal transduction histidine kinase
LLCLLLTVTLLTASCSYLPPALLGDQTATPIPDASPGLPHPAAVALAARPARGKELTFKRLSLEQGLSQSSVFAITQDAQGFMWFGTQDGLNKYDGYNFTVYRPVPGEADSLSSNYIQALYADEDGMLWIGTRGAGLDRMDRSTGEIVHFRPTPRDQHSLDSGNVLVIYEDRQDELWVGTEAGLNRFDRRNQQFDHYEHDVTDPSSLSYGAVRAIHEDGKGTLWIGTEGGGLNRFDREREEIINYQYDPTDPHSLSSNAVKAVYEDHEGNLWVGTGNGGLNRFDPLTGRFVHYRHNPLDPHSLGNDNIQAILEDRSGILWIGTSGGGLARYDRGNDRFINYEHDLGDPTSLSHNWVGAIYEDESGALWIGTWGGGLNRVDCAAEPFALHQASPADPAASQDGPSQNFVWSLFEDQDGALWVGTFGAGLDKYDRDTGLWEHYEHEPDNPYSLSHNIVRSIQQDPNGLLWIGTEGGGLNRFDPDDGQFTHYQNNPQEPGSLSTDAILTVYVDRSGTVWVGTWNGLNKLDRNTGRFVRYQHDSQSQNSLSNNVIRSIYQDRQGTLWIGTENGLNRFDPERETFARYYANPRDRHSLSHNSILSIMEDRLSVLWIGTFGGGLNRLDLDTETFSHYLESDGLPSNVVYGALEDELGFLWLSTNKGLSRFDPRSETFVNYDVTDGLQSNEFNAGAYVRTRDGEMFFGGVDGFNGFRPDRVTRNPYAPPVVLTTLQQAGVDLELGKPVESVDEVTLRWPNNFFEFGFVALSFCQPERNQYAYMLEGLDRDWVHAGKQRFGRYTNLAGKTYTLRIKASNNDGVWNEVGTAIRITVIPPFWATWWFRGGTILIVLVGAVAGYRLRVRSIEARSRQLETQVAQRTRELRQRTQELERRRQELEALYRADAELHRHLGLDEVLQALVDIAVDILQADKSSLLLWDKGRERMAMQVARGFRPEAVMAISFARDEGIAGEVVSTGEPVILEDAPSDPRLEAESHEIVDLVLAEGIRSCMFLPIKVEGEVFGVFNVNMIEPRAFGSDEQRLFMALAQRAAQAIDTAQLYEQSQELAVVEERSRLARELHDAVTQTLFSASLIAEALPELWESDPEEGRQLLVELRQLSRGALAEMRTLLMELRPTALAESDLAELLRQLGEAVTGQTGAPVSVSVENLCALPADVHVSLYRIAQEALNNVVKHANSSQVAVRLVCTPAASVNDGDGRLRVELQVSDNGRGFDVDHIPPDRLGLSIIHERAQAIGAALTIDSQPGQGTVITVVWAEKEEK